MLSHNNSRKDTFQSRNPYSAKLSINTECRMTFVDIQILTNVSPFHDIQKAPRCVLQKKGLQTKKKKGEHQVIVGRGNTEERQRKFPE